MNDDIIQIKHQLLHTNKKTHLIQIYNLIVFRIHYESA